MTNKKNTLYTNKQYELAENYYADTTQTQIEYSDEEKKLEKYFDFLQIWNKKLKLVGNSIEPDKILQQTYMLYSFTKKTLAERNISQTLEHSTLIDIGAGAGLIGVIWKIWHAVENVIFVERSANRAMFLRHVCSHLNLTHNCIGNGTDKDTGNCTVMTQDIKTISIDTSQSSQIRSNKLQPTYIITAQAFATILVLLECIDHLLYLNPEIFLLKQTDIEDELSLAQTKYTFSYKTEKSSFGTLINIYNIKK